MAHRKLALKLDKAAHKASKKLNKAKLAGDMTKVAKFALEMQAYSVASMIARGDGKWDNIDV